jgi:competence protein ComEA
MNWKDYLYFTKGERNGTLMMIFLIILVLMAPLMYGYFNPAEEQDFTAFNAAVEQFEARLAEIRAREEAERTIRSGSRSATLQPQEVNLQPFHFDPNHLSPTQWEQMGMPARIARTIQNYLNAGGSFRYKEDLARIYLINEEMYATLEPFIELPSRPEQILPVREAVSATLREEATAEISIPAVMININTADTIELTQVRGIGPAFSRRIVEYRERLGGYLYTEQLLEVFGIDSVRFEGIRSQVTTGDANPRKININTADLEALRQHPYINYHVANSIVALRRQHGPFQQPEDILKSALINDTLFARIAPYLETGVIEAAD